MLGEVKSDPYSIKPRADDYVLFQIQASCADVLWQAEFIVLLQAQGVYTTFPIEHDLIAGPGCS